MVINQQIETLHSMLESAKRVSLVGFAIYRRLFAIGVVSYMNEVNRDLVALNSKLDSDMDLEAIEIKFDTYLSKSYWYNTGWFGGKRNYYKKLGVDGPYDVVKPYEEINSLIDYLPYDVKVKDEDSNVEKNLFTRDQLDSFKTSMYQFCDNDKMDEMAIHYSLNKGLNTMVSLLREIKRKTENPPEHLLIKLWEQTAKIYGYVETQIEYNDWKDDYDKLRIEKYKEKQMQEVYNFLMSDFLRFRPTPTRGDINRSLIDIPDDIFEAEENKPANLEEKCARFDYFAHWADNDKMILVLDYKRLGKYLCKNKDRLTDEDKEAIVRLDQMLDYIHEDMAELDISLKPYLKRFEENKIKSLINDCSVILNTCQKHLKEDIRNTFLREFLSMLLYDDDMKQEAREKLLSAKNRNKYLCHIIAALDLSYVFKTEVVKEDLARSLSEKFETTSYESTLDNIERFQRKREGTLYEWTRKNVDELKAHPYNPFKGLI